MPNRAKLAIVIDKMRDSRIYVSESNRNIDGLIYESMVKGDLSYIQEIIGCAESPQEKQKILLRLFEQGAATYGKSMEFFNFLFEYSEVRKIFLDCNNIDFIKKILELSPKLDRKLLFNVLLFAIEKNRCEVTEFLLGIKDPEVITNDSESEQFKKVLRAKALELSSPSAQPLKKENHYWFEILIRHRIPIPKQVLESAVRQGDHTLVKRLLASTTVLDYEITDLTIRELLVKAASLNVEILQAVLEGYVAHFAVHLPPALIEMNDGFLGDALDKALFEALKSGRLDCVKLLLQHKQAIDFNAIDENGDTFLMVLVKNFNKFHDSKDVRELCNYFIHQNIDLTIRNKNGETIFTKFFPGTMWGFFFHPGEALLVSLIKKLYKDKDMENGDGVDLQSLGEWTGLNKAVPTSSADKSLGDTLFNLGIYQRYQEGGITSASSNLDIVKLLLAFYQKYVVLTFKYYRDSEHYYRSDNDYIELSLLDCSIINNNELTYQYLRSLEARHQENTLNNIIQIGADSLPNYFLSNYIKDNTGKDLSKLLSKAIETAVWSEKPQIISQLLTHRDRIRTVDLINALKCGFRRREIAVITALVKDPAITDAMILEAALSISTSGEAWLLILKNRPNVDYFLAEFCIHRWGLNTSHYWRNRPDNKNCCFGDIIQHTRGLHVRKYAGGLFTTTYSGRNTRNQLSSQLWGRLPDTDDGIKTFLCHRIASYKCHNPTQYEATKEKILASMRLRSGSQKTTHIMSTVRALKLKFNNINWDTPVEITSWSDTGLRGFFSCGKIKLSLTNYVVQMHNKNREKYIKICSAINETELAEALAEHRTGFHGGTIGRQIYDVVKQPDAQSFEARLDESRPSPDS